MAWWLNLSTVLVIEQAPSRNSHIWRRIRILPNNVSHLHLAYNKANPRLFQIYDLQYVPRKEQGLWLRCQLVCILQRPIFERFSQCWYRECRDFIIMQEEFDLLSTSSCLTLVHHYFASKSTSWTSTSYLACPVLHKSALYNITLLGSDKSLKFKYLLTYLCL